MFIFCLIVFYVHLFVFFINAFFVFSKKKTLRAASFWKLLCRIDFPYLRLRAGPPGQTKTDTDLELRTHTLFIATWVTHCHMGYALPHGLRMSSWVMHCHMGYACPHGLCIATWVMHCHMGYACPHGLCIAPWVCTTLRAMHALYGHALLKWGFY